MRVIQCEKKGSKLVPVAGATPEEITVATFLGRLGIVLGSANAAFYSKSMKPAAYFGTNNGNPFMLCAREHEVPTLEPFDIEWILTANSEFNPTAVWLVL